MNRYAKKREGRAADLLVDFPLQLHDLVLHAFVELLEVLHRASFDLQLLQLAPGPHPADAALQVDDGDEAALVPAASQPAPNVLLNDHHFVLPQQLQKDKKKTNSVGDEQEEHTWTQFQRYLSSTSCDVRLTVWYFCRAM